MNNYDYGLEYIQKILVDKSSNFSLENVEFIIQKVNNMNAFKSFIFSVYSYFYTCPKEVYESILAVKSIDNGFDENKSMEFVTKIISDINEHLDSCDYAEFFDIDGYIDLDIQYKNKSILFSINTYSGGIKVVTKENNCSQEIFYTP